VNHYVRTVIDQDRVRAALADPALEHLAAGPAKDLLALLAAKTGDYEAHYVVAVETYRPRA
jgi:hypothetical protein